MRTYIQLQDWIASQKHNSTRKINEQKRKTARQKFAKCSVCGGQMTFVPTTNILICENEVEKKKIITNADGSKGEKTFTERCGNINLVDDQYLGYLNYLFMEA